MGNNQIFKIDNSKNEFILIPIENSIRIIPEKGAPFTITNNGSNNISIIVKQRKILRRQKPNLSFKLGRKVHETFRYNTNNHKMV